VKRFAVAVALALALAGIASATAAARPVRAKLPSACRSSSWFAGTTDVCRGKLIYRDYVYDDYGADTGAALTATTAGLSPSAGDQKYPSGEENTADLVKLRIWIKGRRLHIWGLLNTLYHRRSTILAVAIGHRGARGGRWPGLDVSSRGWSKVFKLRRGNPKTNVIKGAFRIPRGRVWRVQAVTAQSNGTVMNVAFRGPNEQATFGGAAAERVGSLSDAGSWFENEQAAALHSGDISRFGYTIRVSTLRRHRSRIMHVGPGLHERVYRSAYTLPPGEGISDSGIPGRGNGGGKVKLGFEQSFAYLGHYQPYGVYIPHGKPPYALVMYYHGTGANFSSQINQPGMQQRFAEQPHRLLVAPLARGPNGYSSDISERDELDVLHDAEAHFRVDRSQVFSTGYSQGGYIAWYWPEEYPQLFAGVVTWVGFTGDDANGNPAEPHYTAGAVGNVLDFVPSLLNIPTFMLFSGADELVHVWTARAMDQAFKATPNIYTWYLHPAADHLTYIELDDWRKEAADIQGLHLVSNPVHVVYVRDPVTDSPRYGIVHNRAYWVSAITDRSQAGYGRVDLTNAGCGGSVPRTVTGSGSGTDPVPWISDYRRAVGSTQVARAPRLSGSLENVASARIDARQTCLRGSAVAYDITTDGPASLTFSDSRTLSFGGAGRHVGTLAR
jgi:pimeloyl-ACP methyl ester carboxylesterase